MDQTDYKILEILQEDASIPISEVAERVHLSQTPCWRRIQKMEAQGIILRRVALVDPEALGLGLTVFVQVAAFEHTEAWLDQFTSFVLVMPEVRDIYRMAGEVDYLLRVAVANMTAFDAFYRKLISAVPFKNVTSIFAMERVQVRTSYQMPL